MILAVKYNKQFKSLCIALTGILIVFFVYGAYRAPSTKSFYRFGVTYMTMNNPFYEVINNEMKKQIEANGDKLIVYDPAMDAKKQEEQILSFIEQGVDGIFVNPVDSSKIEASLNKAKEKGIPVIIIDAPVERQDLVLSTIVSDNYDAGVKCAKDMMKRKESANIVLLKHTTVGSGRDRIDGFLDAIKDNKNYQVVNEAECEGQLEIAMPLMQDIIEETADFDVVMALNDPSALGALAALEYSGREDVIVYGVDGTPDIKKLIGKNEFIGGTVAQSPIQIGKNAIDTMYDFLSGKKINQEIIIPVTLINSSNINDYDDKGWQ